MPLENVIDRIRTGDQEVLEEVYRTYREPFAAWLRKQYKCTNDEAMEFYQTSILILYDNIVQGKLEQLSGSIKTYLFAIGKNKWREYHRYKQRNHHQDQFDHLHLLVEEEPEALNPHIQGLKHALIKLGDPCKALLEAFYYQKLKLDEIVVRMKYKNKDTAKNVKYKCIQRLKRLMAKA